MIYFIQAGGAGPIKIGLARDPVQRLIELQVGNAQELHLCAAVRGGKKEEAALHAKFAALHIRGEWFRPAPELYKE